MRDIKKTTDIKKKSAEPVPDAVLACGKWFGATQSGHPNGSGVLITVEGVRIKCCIENHDFVGLVTATWPDAKEYHGSMKYSPFGVTHTGHGTMSYQNVKRAFFNPIVEVFCAFLPPFAREVSYTTDWKNGVREGEGTSIDSKGRSRQRFYWDGLERTEQRYRELCIPPPQSTYGRSNNNYGPCCGGGGGSGPCCG